MIKRILKNQRQFKTEGSIFFFICAQRNLLSKKSLGNNTCHRSTEQHWTDHYLFFFLSDVGWMHYFSPRTNSTRTLSIVSE